MSLFSTSYNTSEIPLSENMFSAAILTSGSDIVSIVIKFHGAVRVLIAISTNVRKKEKKKRNNGLSENIVYID